MNLHISALFNEHNIIFTGLNGPLQNIISKPHMHISICFASYQISQHYNKKTATEAELFFYWIIFNNISQKHTTQKGDIWPMAHVSALWQNWLIASSPHYFPCKCFHLSIHLFPFSKSTLSLLLCVTNLLICISWYANKICETSCRYQFQNGKVFIVPVSHRPCAINLTWLTQLLTRKKMEMPIYCFLVE